MTITTIEKKLTEKILLETQSEAKEIKDSTVNEIKAKEGYYVFFSFDLVNSTSYKLKNKKDWPNLFNSFYDYLKERMDLHFGLKAHVWKYVGDEVLFFMKIENTDQFLDLCNKTAIVQNEVTQHLHDKKFKNSKGLLYIKATIWSAEVEAIVSKDLESISQNVEKNLLFTKVDSKGATFDFLGPGIDIGFRISRFSEKNKLVVGAELAYILYENRGPYESTNSKRIEDKLKIVSFESLKGIWNERKYPIIWYHEHWEQKEDIFEYDEKYNSSLINQIISSDFNLGNISMLKKIYQDLDMMEFIHNILTKFKQNEYNKPFNQEELVKNIAEIHCVAVCINRQSQILIARRTNKTVNNKKWEFGCGQIHMGTGFNEFLKETYKNDFGINIELLSDDNELVPIATYTLNDKLGKKTPGIIFVAEFSDTNISDYPEKYSDVKLISLEELSKYNEGDLVPLMYKNAEKAISFLKNYKGEI